MLSDIIRAYLRCGGNPDVPGRGALAGIFGLALCRLAYSMWLSLGHRNVTEGERVSATAYVDVALAKLALRLKSADRLVEVITRTISY